MELAAGPRNRFVCQQLASMAHEQLRAVAAAAERGDRAYLLAASGMHFAQLEAGGEVVAGALFYPRACSQRAAAAQERAVTAPTAAGAVDGSCIDPHCYIELMCTRQPGQHWGTLLLRHVKVKVGKSLHKLNFPVLTSSFRPLFDLSRF